MVKWLASIVALLLLSGCFTPGGVKKLGESYQTVFGRLAAPPVLANNRLFLYIKLTPKDGQEEGTILICVAENEDKEQILKVLADSVMKAGEYDKPLAIIGEHVRGPWQEYAEGIDFEVYAVGYWNPAGEKYQTVMTTYGTKAMDLLSSISWRSFLQTLGKKAVDVAL